ncbi:MAG: hypothetical protein J7L23_01265 [Candidatus Diapherotrites archaeon]|nr:hypothetical protein [Candidatus Diapherotrites archaeon]
MIKAILILLVVGIAILAGCVEPTPLPLQSENYTNHTNYTEQPINVPMPTADELNNSSEPPEFPF